jgi:hypothetical protein
VKFFAVAVAFASIYNANSHTLPPENVKVELTEALGGDRRGGSAAADAQR